MDYRLAIIANRETALGFKALGMDAFVVQRTEEINSALDQIKAKGGYAAIFVTEDCVKKVQEKLEEIKTEALPAIICLPTQHGTTGLGRENLRQIVERAVGSDILFKDK